MFDIPGVRRLLRLRPTPRSIEGEVGDEIRFHLDARAGQLVRQGLDAESARERALAEFGDVRAARGGGEMARTPAGRAWNAGEVSAVVVRSGRVSSVH